jgi:hypothetical protein
MCSAPGKIKLTSSTVTRRAGCITQLLFQQNALILLKAQAITICTFLSLYS